MAAEAYGAVGVPGLAATIRASVRAEEEVAEVGLNATRISQVWPGASTVVPLTQVDPVVTKSAAGMCATGVLASGES